MSRSIKLFILCVVAVAYTALVGDLLRPQLLSASPQLAADPRTACAEDVQKLCSNVPPGGGRIIACLKQHKDEVSQGCKQAIVSAMQPSRGGGGSNPSPAPTPVAQPDTGTTVSAPPAPAPPSPPAQRESHSSTTTAAGQGQRYFLMKQVKIIDQGLGQGKPAYDVMIPTAWQFKGWVNINATEGGCFADWFAVVGDAKSADNSIEMQILPQFTWQYIDDPAGQQQMQMQNRKDAQFGMKPCPVRAPIQAADFLRQDMMAQHTKGATLISVEAFPELDQMVRQRLGLPPTAAGGGAGGIRTNAARARVTFTDDKGQPIEEWITAATVVRAFPVGGHTAYDWHAVMVMDFRAPKGKLDANDRLFKLMASTVRPEREWQKWSNGIIAGLYQKKQEELAKQAAMIAAFRQHVADTINDVTANSMAGSNHAAYGESQLIRGVQTFRDPSTGSTFELSNQYDNAWLNNGANQYIMSDDQTFNPNGNLSGNWTQLQVVR